MLLTIRRVARFVLASVLWLHGLLLFEVAKPNLAPLAARLSLNINEVTIFCLIATLSILATYGVSNILVDMLYIYFFPFVLLYWTARLAYKLVRALNRVFAALSIDDVEPFDLHSIPGWPSPVTVPASTTGQQAGQQQAQPEPTKSAKSPSSYLRQLLTAPFVRFSLLWCLLLLLTTRPTLLWIALVVVLAHIGRALVKIVGATILTTNWLAQLEDRIKAQAERWISEILAASESAPSEVLNQTVRSLTGLQLALTFFRNRQRAAQWAIFIGLIVFAAVYLYLALLFSFAYCGIARLTHIALTWSDSLVYSIFIPFAFSDLPKNPWIKGLAGFHACFVVALGISTVFAYFKRKLNSLYDVADSLNSRLQQPDVRAKIVVVTEKLKPANTGTQPSSASHTK